MPRGFGARLGLLVGLGVLIRVTYTVLVAPWPPKALTDEVYFNIVPHLVADGRGFIQPVLAIVGRSVPTAAHPPLYPVLLAGLAKLGGTGDVAQRLTGSVFGAGTIVAVALLARRIAGDRAALIAAAIAALYPIFITADGALMSESLYGLLVAVSLLAAYRLVEAPTPGRAVVLGVTLGLAALTRGEAILLLLLLLIPVARRPRGLRTAAIACVTALAVLTPWTVRNQIVFHQFVPIATDSGTAIGGANCPPVYYGSGIGGWYLFCTKPSSNNEAVQTARDRSAGVHYAVHHLTRLPLVFAARLLRVWGVYQPFKTDNGRSPAVEDIGVVTYWLLIPLAIYGFVLLRRRQMSTWLLIAPCVAVSLTALLAYGIQRFREPADISLVVLAAIALDQFSTRLGSRRRAVPAVH
jgi:4-amino-4-deoxy-L-arabinose transferase-like glycosyltransferase